MPSRSKATARYWGRYYGSLLGILLTCLAWLGLASPSVHAGNMHSSVVIEANSDAALAAPNAPTMEQLADAVVIARALNLRSGPGATYERIGVVYQGDELDVIGQVRACAWLQVVAPNGTVGWISGGASYIERHFNCSDIQATGTASVPAAGNQPVPTQVPAPAANAVPSGTFRLVSPVNEPAYGTTPFVWEWDGELPPDYGFEIVMWRSGDPPRGIHDAVRDNQQHRIASVGQNRYRLDVDITNVPSVQGRDGEYWWTVRLIRTSPSYAPTELQAERALIHFRMLDRKGDGKASPCPTYGCGTSLRETPSAGQIASTATWLACGILLGIVLVRRQPGSRKDR